MFPGIWRCARGGFRHAESESEVKNDGKQPPEREKEENRNLKNKFHDSRPLQLPEYTVLRQESDFQVENSQFCQLDVKNEEKRNE